jgi:hypothetical protein
MTGLGLPLLVIFFTIFWPITLYLTCQIIFDNSQLSATLTSIVFVAVVIISQSTPAGLVTFWIAGTISIVAFLLAWLFDNAY